MAEVNDDLVVMLEQVLAEAKRGKWQAAAVILCPHPTNSALGLVATSEYAGWLIHGAEGLKLRLLEPSLHAKPSVDAPAEFQDTRN